MHLQHASLWLMCLIGGMQTETYSTVMDIFHNWTEPLKRFDSIIIPA